MTSTQSQHPPVRKAVIAVAGFGTRFLPMTKAIPKEMLPIINKPIVQYIAEELSASGIKEIILVTNWQKKSLEDHFDPSFELEHDLLAQGKHEIVTEIKNISKLAKFIYVRQVEGYGNALPVVSVRELIGNEPFIYAFGDDLVKSVIPFAKQLIDTYEATGESVVGAQEVAPKDVSRYGIIKLAADGTHMESVVEKPAVEDAPSRLAVVGRYLFTPAIFKALDQITQGKNNEYWIADAIQALLATEPVRVQPVEGGRWLTTGDPATYLEALLEYSMEDPVLREVILKVTGGKHDEVV